MSNKYGEALVGGKVRLVNTAAQPEKVLRKVRGKLEEISNPRYTRLQNDEKFISQINPTNFDEALGDLYAKELHRFNIRVPDLPKQQSREKLVEKKALSLARSGYFKSQFEASRGVPISSIDDWHTAVRSYSSGWKQLKNAAEQGDPRAIDIIQKSLQYGLSQEFFNRVKENGKAKKGTPVFEYGQGSRNVFSSRF